MLKYQIGDDEKKILKGKELCLVVTNVLNQIIILPEFEQFVQLTPEPEQKESKTNITESIDEIDKNIWFEYFKEYQHVEFPRGVTPKRIDKVKADIINSGFFIELCTSAKKNGSKEFHDSYAADFLDYCYDELLQKGIIKI